MIDHLDHLVLTTTNEAACIDFYTRVLGMTLESFVGGTPAVTRQAFKFGLQKINLHIKGAEFEPKAHLPVPGALDVCFIASVPLAQLADLQSHGALVLGPASGFSPQQLDLRTLQAHLTFNSQVAASAVGGNPAEDVWRMLARLAQHCVQRGQPLRAGQIVTTGSSTGMLFSPEGASVVAELAGIGRVELQF